MNWLECASRSTSNRTDAIYRPLTKSRLGKNAIVRTQPESYFQLAMAPDRFNLDLRNVNKLPMAERRWTHWAETRSLRMEEN